MVCKNCTAEFEQLNRRIQQLETENAKLQQDLGNQSFIFREGNTVNVDLEMDNEYAKLSVYCNELAEECTRLQDMLDKNSELYKKDLEEEKAINWKMGLYIAKHNQDYNNIDKLKKKLTMLSTLLKKKEIKFNNTLNKKKERYNVEKIDVKDLKSKYFKIIEDKIGNNKQPIIRSENMDNLHK